MEITSNVILSLINMLSPSRNLQKNKNLAIKKCNQLVKNSILATR